MGPAESEDATRVLNGIGICQRVYACLQDGSKGGGILLLGWLMVTGV